MRLMNQRVIRETYKGKSIWIAQGRVEAAQIDLLGLGASPDQAVDDLCEKFAQCRQLLNIKETD